ncbi:SagB/ThcOx family dehydrogenase [Streptomyces sp. NPDC051207]|uniref:SagB/ThcOx family dehydrogenase n=1 Tax=Streptomyces sp. NPDC051207 TaxID=3154641 RepID=UPI00342E0933
MDLVTALARARSPEVPGPDTPAGAPVRAWPGPPRPVPDSRPGELPLERLLRLSLAASDRAGRLRPAASAGALHPVDAELVVGPRCPLPPGRYGYDPVAHRVHHLGPADAPPGATVELRVTPQRTVSHYGHRAWPLLLLDTGHAAAAVWAGAWAVGTAEAGLRLDGSGDRDGSGRGLGEGSGFTSGNGPGEGSGLGEGCGPGEGAPLAAVHVPVPQGRRPVEVSPAPEWAPLPGDLPARRSAPPPLPGTPPADTLRDVLAAATAAAAGEVGWCVAVGGPRPGLVELAEDGGLRRFAAGDARPTLAAWAAGQAWIADAGAVLLARGCPADADTRHILRAHLHAGFAVHIAHLTAVRRGLAARPVGSWQQADLGAALGAAPGRDWVVHGLVLGTVHPEERTP